MEQECELTILMPCLNEAETLGICVDKALAFIKNNNIFGEVLVADNGSTDDSRKIAEQHGARVQPVSERGYGSALIGGTKAAYGKYVIMGDADDSYDFVNLMPFVEKLRSGYDLVMGNRFKGGIMPHAMPPLHRYIGNPVLSGIGRLFYRSKIGDFHCGLRGYNRDSIIGLDLQTTGMEYASEMVVKSTLNGLKIAEVPTVLSPDGRSHPPYLRSWSDGWRHLKFLLVYSPRWLFFYPGMFLFILGIIGTVILTMGPVRINYISFDITTLLYSSMAMISGIQIIFFALFTKVYATKAKLLPEDKTFGAKIEKFTLERGISIGVTLILIGIIATIVALVYWGDRAFGNLIPSHIMRITIPAITAFVIGIQISFSSFFLYILNIDHK